MINLVTKGMATGLGNVVYCMRGRDGTLVQTVYWQSATVDSTGVDYSGPGPLTQIVVVSRTAL